MKTYLFSIVASALLVSPLAITQNQIPRSVMGNGGNIGTNSQFRLAGTLGQATVGISMNNSRRVNAGFWPQVQDAPVAVAPVPANVPEAFRLEQNYPNPFNPSTTIKYQIPTTSRVTLKIYNALGQDVASLVDDVQDAGYKSVVWSAGTVASGVYFYRLDVTDIVSGAARFSVVRKMAVVK